MGYWRGRPPNVNDKHRGMVPPSYKSSTEGEYVTQAEMDQLEANKQQEDFEQARADFKTEKEFLRHWKAMKVMQRVRDKRTHPLKVSKDSFGYLRKNRLNRTKRIKRKHRSVHV